MPPPGLSAAVARARRAVAPADPRPDGALLAAFVAARDGEAFAALVERFGPMVFAVCRRATGHHQDAEDAFQAVFVVLARRAAAVVPREAVGGWLYGVAVRTAREARTMAARRSAREAPSSHLTDSAGSAVGPEPDLAAVIDAELAALSEKDRALLVRCDLRDESQVEVAAALGVPVGTVYSRLAAARKRLAARLTARGVAPGAGGLAVALGGAAAAAVPADLPARAVAAALTPEHAPAAVAALSHGVLRAMFLHKLKLVPLALAAVASAAVAAGLLAAPSATAPQPAPPARVAAAQPAASKVAPVAKGPNRILLSKDRALVMVDPDGKNLTPVAAFDPEAGYAYDAKLSPDGTRVAVVRSVGAAQGDAVSRRSLFVFPASGKGEPADLNVDGESAYWSADGTELVVARANDRPGGKGGPNFEHRVVDAKTGKASAVKLPADHIVTGWLADGRFSTTRLGGTPADPTARVYVMNRDGTEARAVTDATAVVAGGMPSPDGTRMLGQRPVFKAGANRVDVDEEYLVLIDTATGRVTPVTGVPPGGDLHGYCWSPDGKRIAYTWRQVHPGTPDERARTETESRLVVADPDGKNARTVLSAKGPSQWTITLGAPDWR
ncbi:sigma-70 family RNA polymerase sigma factor [Urbifossiella limnaea]|uniref:ECF RNA polymerase sigma factor RpoE n=1 Tax=Urbifossiella limnaea TaxID=2528023 RepID=A0A517XZH9_9BACT|nr:sigma-70 family RNA polymerase sigma factor [Urbifossiella limnaea]QDU22916.1 ECF RNA polymerase sigma factor RpoE [Urbifossiella limnaea]